MTRRNPLVDPLTDEAKAALAVKFARMRRQCQPLDVEQQRFHNRVWNLPQRRACW
jgi:hypothetical protein